MKIGSFKLFNRTNWGLSVMDLYIIRELISPFIFGMGVFTSLGLSIGAVFELVREVAESGLPIEIAFKILLLKMPEFIVLAFPMSILLASMMAYSRLSSDSELIALRSIGVNIYRLILPTIIFSLLIVILTFLIDNFVVPAANYEAKITLEKALDKPKPTFKTENILLPQYESVEIEKNYSKKVMTRLFYAEEFDGDRMKNITVLDRNQRSVSQIITASSAQWNVSENIWDFYNGTIYLISIDGEYQNIVRFQHQQLALPQTAFNLAKQTRKPEEMNIFQAREYLKIIKLGGSEKNIRKVQVKIQSKISLPCICLVFALIGSALGAKPQNSGRATSFGICIGLIFSYYLLSFICESLGIAGVLTPVLAAWLPNILGLSASGYLLAKATNY
ncbi:MAG: LptF/LptG family permease [Pleurocapsa sp.]